MNANEIIIASFKKELGHVVKAYGIRNLVKQYGFSGPFAYIPEEVDLVELLEEIFPEYANY